MTTHRLIQSDSLTRCRLIQVRLCKILARGMLYIVNYRVFPKFLLLFRVVSISVFSTGYLVYFLLYIAYFRLLLFQSLLLASITFSGSRFAYINFSFSCVYKLSFLCSGDLFFLCSRASRSSLSNSTCVILFVFGQCFLVKCSLSNHNNVSIVILSWLSFFTFT